MSVMITFLKINKYEFNQLHFQNNQLLSTKVQEEIIDNKRELRRHLNF